MAVWLNMKGKDASLCASVKEGVQKLQGMIAKRSGEGTKVSPLNIAPALGVHYTVTSRDHGIEEFWLSDESESTQE